MKAGIQEKVNTNELFQGIGADSLTRMLECSKSRISHYRSGEVIFHEEEVATKLFVLLEGAVHIVKNFASGRKKILLTLEEGEIFGENFFFGKETKYWYDAESYKEAYILEIPWRFFYCFCDSACAHHQQLVQNMLGILSMKQFAITKRLQIVSTSSLRERIAIWLIDEADGHGKVTMKMKRDALADMLGVARPSLSRELMKMQDDGLIRVEKKEICIINKEEMENLYN
ncbi:MAG: Crp/Fnr family transcriptional regulator [Hespellia sp.]|nr:Crp/Fnr family transcriptional regulator [Hespellia sp.]